PGEERLDVDRLARGRIGSRRDLTDRAASAIAVAAGCSVDCIFAGIHRAVVSGAARTRLGGDLRVVLAGIIAAGEEGVERGSGAACAGREREPIDVWEVPHHREAASAMPTLWCSTRGDRDGLAAWKRGSTATTRTALVPHP